MFFDIDDSICFISCNKAKEMKDKLFPERPYEKAQIDKFYWTTNGWDFATIPLIKPYKIQQMQGAKNWALNTLIKNPKIVTFHRRNMVLNNFELL